MNLAADQPGSRRSRGRVPRLTRDLIIAATAELLRQEPQTPPTMARVAEAVGASPMALYRHFTDRDDLFLAVARHVLTSQATRLPKNASWQQELQAWMLENYRQARLYPQLMQLSLSGDATVWLGDAAVLVQILDHAGIPPETMPHALHWIATTTLGHCLIAAAAPDQLPTARLYAALGELPDAQAARLAPILSALPRDSEEAFRLVIEATIGSVAHFIPRRPRR